MATEYRLSHTASEIDRKLSEIDNLGKVKTVNGVEPDASGNVVIEVGNGSGQNVELDTTLTQSGKAADAKATGDGLSLKADQTWFERLLAKLGYAMEDLIEKLPQVRIDGDISGISADDYVNVTCRFVDEKNNVEWTDYAEMAWQGSGSLSFVNVVDGVDVAKNFKIKLYKDEARSEKSKRVFRDWHATNNFHLKCNYADATNIMNNLMMHYITKSYQYLTPLPRAGARFTVDGFPVLLWVNDVFCGIRFWNLKQDDKVYSLNEEVVDEATGEVTQEADLCYQVGLNNGTNSGDNSGAFVYGNLNSGSNAGKNFADAHAEIDYYWEDRVWDKPGNHPAVLYDTIQWVSEATDEEFKANLEQYFDKAYLINYFVIMYTCGMIDSKGKNFNMLYFPEKGVWYPTFWDMDNAFGTSYHVGKTSYKVELSNFGCPSSRLFDKLWANFKDECIAKYHELRQNLFTREQVEDSIDQTLLNVSAEWLDKNFEVKYNGTVYSPGTNPKNYILNWALQRFAYMDTVMELVESNPTTSISLSASTLTFENAETQTLVATVTPADSTDAVVWESSNTDVATVADGVVTPVKKGECIITATSGAHSASCAVVVEFEEENPGSASYTQGYINDYGLITESTSAYVDNNYREVKPADDLFVVTPVDVGVVRIAEYDADKNFLRRGYIEGKVGTTVSGSYISKTCVRYKPSSDVAYVRIGFQNFETASVDELFAGYYMRTAVLEANEYVTGVQANYQNGAIELYVGKFVTAYIPVSAETVDLSLSGSPLSSSSFGIRCYDGDKTFLGNITGTSGADGTFTLKTGTAFICLSGVSGVLTEGETLMVSGVEYILDDVTTF